MDVSDLLIFSFTGKKFGVTEFVSAENIGDKPVSQVALNSNLLISFASGCFLLLILCSFYLTTHKQIINEMTGGGADYCFECVGLSSLVQEAYACCRKVSVSICNSQTPAHTQHF